MLLRLWCSYYSLEDASHPSLSRYLSGLVERSLRELEGSSCVEVEEVEQEQGVVQPLACGRICSYYYLKHQTMRTFRERLQPEMTAQELLPVLAVRLALAKSQAPPLSPSPCPPVLRTPRSMPSCRCGTTRSS